MDLCKWWWSPIIYTELHNLKWCSIDWIMELHNWIMEPHTSYNSVKYKQNFILQKISPHNFYFLLCFQSVLVHYETGLINSCSTESPPWGCASIDSFFFLWLHIADHLTADVMYKHIVFFISFHGNGDHKIYWVHVRYQQYHKYLGK